VSTGPEQGGRTVWYGAAALQSGLIETTRKLSLSVRVQKVCDRLGWGRLRHEMPALYGMDAFNSDQMNCLREAGPMMVGRG